LDKDAIRDYLSFVAPVSYQNTFYYRKKIYAHAGEIGVGIDEYNIYLDAQLIYKKYITDIKDASNKKIDDIYDVDFFDLRDDNACLLGWMWFGLSKFTGEMRKINTMRGIRLRTGNIQIGTEDALQKLFPEERANRYFIGEVFSLSPELIPNSRRDYFNETQVCVVFEKLLRQKFKELWKLCHDASEVNSTNKKIASLAEHQKAFDEKQQQGHYAGNKEEEQKELKKLAQSQQEVTERLEKQKKKLETLPKGSLSEQVISRIVNNTPTPQPSELFAPTEPAKSEPLAWLRSQLPRRDKAELKLVNKILTIIRSNVDKEISDMLIEKIIDGLK